MTERLEYLRSWGYQNNLIGIDASHWQGQINWDIMKSRGIGFATIRCTVGDYYKDPMRFIYHKSARERGIYTSDYHVMRTQATAQNQMDWYFSNQPHRPDYPIGLDVEWEMLSDNTSYYDPEETTERALQCAEIIKSRDGRDPLLYSAPYYLKDFVNVEELNHLPLWIAHYGVNFPGQYWINSEQAYGNLLEEMGYGTDGWEFWQCMADGDNQGEYFGSGAKGLDVNFYQDTLREFERKYIRRFTRIIRNMSAWRQHIIIRRLRRHR